MLDFQSHSGLAAVQIRVSPLQLFDFFLNSNRLELELECSKELGL